MFVGIKRIDFARKLANSWPTEKQESIAVQNLSREDVVIDCTKKTAKSWSREKKELLLPLSPPLSISSSLSFSSLFLFSLLSLFLSFFLSLYSLSLSLLSLSLYFSLSTLSLLSLSLTLSLSLSHSLTHSLARLLAHSLTPSLTLSRERATRSAQHKDARDARPDKRASAQPSGFCVWSCSQVGFYLPSFVSSVRVPGPCAGYLHCGRLPDCHISGHSCGLFREAVKTARHSFRGSTWMSSVDLLLINVA